MGIETAIAIGIGALGGIAAGSASNRGSKPKIEPPDQRSVQAGLSDAETRRRSVMMRLAQLKKQTLLAKMNEPDAMVKKTILGSA